MVRERVAFGELFQIAEFPPTIQLTKDAESESSRRLVFSAIYARTYVDSFVLREFSVFLTALSVYRLGRNSRQNSRALWLTDPFGLTTWLGSAPESNPSRKGGGASY